MFAAVGDKNKTQAIEIDDSKDSSILSSTKRYTILSLLFFPYFNRVLKEICVLTDFTLILNIFNGNFSDQLNTMNSKMYEGFTNKFLKLASKFY